MLPSLLTPGPRPTYRTISGAGLLARESLPRDYVQEEQCGEHTVMADFSPSDFTLKFWGDKWNIRKDWFWGGQDMGMLRECSGTCHWGHCPCHHLGMLGKVCHIHTWLPDGPEEDGKAFPDTTKSSLTSARHTCRAGLSGKRLGAPGPSHTEHLNDLEQVMFSFLGLFLW